MKRKDFIKKSMFAIGGSLFLPRILQPLWGQPILRDLRESFNNKTVVIINLSGGNDKIGYVPTNYLTSCWVNFIEHMQ